MTRAALALEIACDSRKRRLYRLRIGLKTPFQSYDIFCDVHDSRKRVVARFDNMNCLLEVPTSKQYTSDTLIFFFRTILLHYSKSTHSTMLTIKTETNTDQERMNPLLH